MRLSRLPARLTGILLGLGTCSAPQAGVTVCEDPAEQSFAAVGFVNHASSSLEGRGGSTNQENQELDVLVAHGARGLAWGIGHRYLMFDFSGIEPQTNAHLHTSFLPLHWRLPSRRSLRVSAAVALSASSNLVGRPRDWESDTPQLLAAVIATSPLTDALELRYGVCGDHRFGEYRLYPAAGISWGFHPRWRLELGFPSSFLRFEPGEALRTTLRIAPDGNEWHVKNRELDAGSRFVYEALVLEWTTDWRVQERLTLSVRVGRQLDNRYRMTLFDGERVSVSGAPADRMGFAIRWLF